jgi:serine/threonine-protein kinase SRPK3
LLNLVASRFVALKIAIADTAKGSHEAHILRFINENDTGIGQHILNLLDSFRIEGPNGSHDVLVTEVLVLLRALARYPVYEKV